jgi:ATP-dependent exoDNAse (exonuclease V) alpha subunit
MAIFRLQISTVGRNQGRRATAAAAYRAGERIRDERSGELHNFSSRKDVLHKEIFIPAALHGSAPEWARQREQLWNAAERAETRRTARVAREWQVTLPSELSAAQRVGLAREFSQEIADRYQIAVDLAVHEPRPGGDPRNHHAHILGTTREITQDGLGAKAGIDMAAAERARRGLGSVSQEFFDIRERWAVLTNAALHAAGIDARVDHRSLRAQGIDREPLPSLPLAAVHMERDGQHSEVAARLRAEYRTRLEQREQDNAAGAPPREPRAGDSRSLEDIRREARDNWLRMRAGLGGQSTGVERTAQLERAGGHGLDDDLAR